MRTLTTALITVLALVAAPACAQQPAAPAVPEKPTMDTDEKKTLYALGLALARNLESFGLSKDDLAIVQNGLVDGVLKNEPQLALEEWGPKIQGLQRERQAKVAELEKTAAAEFLAQSATEDGMTKNASGLLYKELVAGTGPSPAATDTVKVHYRGTLRDGTEFDSSYARNQPAEFPLNGVIACWTEGVQKMKVGGKAKLVCPADIAYGERGAPPLIKPGAALVFEVELLEIVKK